MGKVILLLFLLNISFLVATVRATVDSGNLRIVRADQEFQAGAGVYLYSGDFLSLDSGSEILFKNILFKALSNCELKILDNYSFQLFSGTVYIVCSQQPELSFILKDAKITLAAKKYVISKESENLLLYNLGEKINIFTPLSLSVPKDNYIVFTGTSFSRPIAKKIIYHGKLPDPFLLPVTTEKNLGTTCWLSTVLPGLGHIYVESRLKGLIALTAALSLIGNIQNNENKAVYFSLWGWAFLDSLAEARKYNQGIKK